ncbi:SGNH/GDSL hydrolase family protein [Flavobacterium longum]
MKAALQKLALFSVILLAMLLLAAWAARRVSGRESRYHFKASADKMIIGHSYTECGLNDSLIARTINLSQGGESYFYAYLKLKKLLPANPQIKTVLVSYANNQIQERMDKWVWDDKYLDNNLPKYIYAMDVSDYVFLLRKNPVGVFRAELTLIKNAASTAVRPRDLFADRTVGGYLYLKRNKVDSLLKTDFLEKEQKSIRMKVSKANVDYLKKIVELCRKHHVDVVFLRMPMRPDSPFAKNESQFDSIRKADFADVAFLDFKHYPTPAVECGDFEHFNHIGARKFSLFFNDLLSDGLLQSGNKQERIDQAITALTSKKTAE